MKQYLKKTISPLVRFYIRYVPIVFFKEILWRHFYWLQGTYIALTKHGIKMCGNTHDLVQGYIYYFGTWEPNLTAFICKRLTGLENRSFVDVGANVGYFTLLAAKLMPLGSVVAVEAFPPIYKKLIHNIDINKFSNIRSVNCAATAEKCVVPIFHAGIANEGGTTSLPGAFNSVPIEVEGLPLSQILLLQDISTIKLIKIDVEGAEYLVVQGLTSILNQFPLDAEVIVEVSPEMLERSNIEAIFSIFEKEGFYPYMLVNSYDPNYYIKSQQISSPKRLTYLPDKQMDIVFSRSDVNYL